MFAGPRRDDGNGHLWYDAGAIHSDLGEAWAMAKKKPAVVKKTRGGWLTAALVLMMVYGIFAAFVVLYLREQQSGTTPPWVLATLFALAVAHLVAALAIWEWKQWGLMLYAGATVVSIAVGLVLTGTQLWVFHELLPLVILGYLVKDKRQLFT
jgi:cytochrome bd-type quinol oxidase subunit 2